jgi:hypothetical protein
MRKTLVPCGSLRKISLSLCVSLYYTDYLTPFWLKWAMHTHIPKLYTKLHFVGERPVQKNLCVQLSRAAACGRRYIMTPQILVLQKERPYKM